MSRRRFYAPPSAFNTDVLSVKLEAEEARHLRDVLRLKRGDEAFVFDGEGREYRCLISESRRDGALLDISEEVVAARPESPLSLTLGVALLKSEKFDLVVQKTTELGVDRIVPIMTRFAEVRLKEGAEGGNRVLRWKRIALEAAKQSGRARVPEISAPIAFASLIESVSSKEEEPRLIFSEREGRGLLETVRQWPARPLALTALVGPEGGWADEEITQANLSGWSTITLGGRTLRAETAAIAVAALLQHLFGDLV
ncbi:MAG: 16S rRNA (uracil(1498)-N(3))-methyltransferase [Acidobacteria bacterium]|nr:16S rRNA (uracil(1498)-N(3))-methyltransferase [Acidobacteriota bacterium]